MTRQASREDHPTSIRLSPQLRDRIDILARLQRRTRIEQIRYILEKATARVDAPARRREG